MSKNYIYIYIHIYVYTYIYIHIYIHIYIYNYLFIHVLFIRLFIYLSIKYVCIYLLIYIFIYCGYISICLDMYQNPDIFDVRSYIWWFLHWDSHSNLLTLLLEGRQLPDGRDLGDPSIDGSVRLPIFHIWGWVKTLVPLVNPKS